MARSCSGASLRIVSAWYGEENVTQLVQAVVEDGQLHAVGGIETVIPGALLRSPTQTLDDKEQAAIYAGPRMTGIHATKTFSLTYMYYKVKASAFVATALTLEAAAAREVSSHFASATNDSVCCTAVQGDFLAVATVAASSTAAAPLCTEARILVEVGAKTARPSVDASVTASFEAGAVAPEAKRPFLPPPGWSISNTFDYLGEGGGAAELKSCEDTAVELEADGQDLVRFTGEAGSWQGLQIPRDPNGGGRMYHMSVDVRCAQPLNMQSGSGFMTAEPDKGGMQVNYGAKHVASAAECTQSFGNFKAVDICSPEGTKLHIISAKYGDQEGLEDITEAMRKRVVNNRLLYARGAHNLRGRFGGKASPIARPGGRLILEWSCWTPIEFSFRTSAVDGGPAVFPFCVGSVGSNTIELSNWTVYELQRDTPDLSATTVLPPDFISGPRLQWQISKLRAAAEDVLELAADLDALRLKEGCDGGFMGWGTDDDLLVNIFASRSDEELKRLQTRYYIRYDKTLADQIKDETSGHYKQFLLFLQAPKALADAKLLNKCMEGLGTNDDVLIELACTRSREELTAAVEAYAMLYDRRCTYDIKGDTSGGYERFLLAVLRCERDSDATPVDSARAKEQAKKLEDAEELGEEELADALIDLLTSASPAQLAEIGGLEEKIEIACGSGFFGESDLHKCFMSMLQPRESPVFLPHHEFAVCTQTLICHHLL